MFDFHTFDKYTKVGLEIPQSEPCFDVSFNIANMDENDGIRFISREKKFTNPLNTKSFSSKNTPKLQVDLLLKALEMSKVGQQLQHKGRFLTQQCSSIRQSAQVVA